MPQNEKLLDKICQDSAQKPAEEPESNIQKIRNKYPVWQYYTPGRKTQCTYDCTNTICEILADGNYIETAVQAVGIGVSTLYDWLSWGERDAKKGLYPGFSGSPDESPYLAFSEAVKQARAIAEVGLLREIRHDRDNKTFAPLAWILERTRNDRYGQRQQVDVTHTVSGPDVPQQAPATHAQWLEQRQAERALLQAQAEDVAYTDVTSDVTEGEQDTGAS